jgi:glycosyltransferase involved in cell wall biosynthesis
MTVPHRPRVLIWADWFTPGYKAGGPIRSLDSLTRVLGERCDVSVVTRDRDLGDESPYPDITPDIWLELGRGVQVMYLSPHRQSLRHIADLVRREAWDCLYLNSMYSRRFTLYPLLAARRMGRRIVLAPRGMLHAGAMRLKPVKKRVFLAAFRLAGLARGIVFQATDPREELDIARSFGRGVSIAAVPDWPAPLPPQAPGITKRAGELKIVCVARVARNKNIRYLLERLQPLAGDVSVALYGPVEDVAYDEECRAAGAALPRGMSYRSFGSVPPHQIPAAIGSAHVFCLPTEGENFCHAIWEALAVGRSVLVSDRTPWRNLSDSGAGWDIPLEHPAEWTEQLDALVRMNQAEWDRHCLAARAQAENFLSRSDVADSTMRMLFGTP